jgi:arginyl-tRNA synthetase
MVAWEKFGEGKTPDSTGIKGDHFVGDYYVQFGVEMKKEVEQLMIDGMTKDEAEKNAPLMLAAQRMLIDWENGDAEVRTLWERMNGWVYEGFNETYNKIGSDFDKNYFESETYLLGKEIVEEGLSKGVFFKKDDGSVWVDLTADGLDEKLVLRKDGTSVYITQDLGLADRKFEEFSYEQSFYVIADEQNYHMKVLKLILQKLGKPYADGIFHLSYGLVELPSGRMKTREGTVVDADDLLEELKRVAREKTEELGKVKDFNPGELNELHEIIALGALKFFLLRVDPKKRMVFNPEESIDIHGFTGPFVQYTYARIRSMLRKEQPVGNAIHAGELFKLEKDLIVLLEQYNIVVEQALNEHNPSVIAIYVFNVARMFNSFYSEHKVLNAESDEKKELRLQISSLAANVISSGMGLLGIRVPERM